MELKHVSRFFYAMLLVASCSSTAAVLPEAEQGITLPLTSAPTSRPMAVAYIANYNRYYVADGGLGGVPDGVNSPVSPSEVHAYDAKGKRLQTVKPGIDNRSLYFDPNTRQLVSVSYNVSSGAGFLPGCGIFALELDDKGNLSGNSKDLLGFNPAFGDAATMPTYDPVGKRYFAKQERSNKVWIVDPGKRENIGEIQLDLAAAKVAFDDISDHFVAYSGIPGEELLVLDVDHKAVLVFDIQGKFVGRSALPSSLKLRAKNHYNGLGYANGMMFVYHETEGEFGTYHGYRVSDKAEIIKGN